MIRVIIDFSTAKLIIQKFEIDTRPPGGGWQEVDMSRIINALSPDQWEFIATLEAIGSPVPIDAAKTLAAISSSSLFDLIRKAEGAGWISVYKNYNISLNADLPKAAADRIQRINSREQIDSVIERLNRDSLSQRLDPAIVAQLLLRAGRVEEASQIEFERSCQAIKNNQLDLARTLLSQIMNRLYDSCDTPNSKALYVSAALRLSDLCFTMWQGLPELITYLDKAHELAWKLGDRRSHALINFHLGRIYYFSDKRAEAITALSLGFEEIDDLGDDDMLVQASGFLGLFHFIQGRLREAMQHFERAEAQDATSEEGALHDPVAPILMDYCAFYLGQFHAAIGGLDLKWRLAKSWSDDAMAVTLRACLGTLLGLLNKKTEALIHLRKAGEEAQAIKNYLAIYLAKGGMAALHLSEDRTKKAYELLRDACSEATKAGLIRQFFSPYVLEMIAEFHRLGFPPIPELKYADCLERIWNEANVHLRGVALRLVAREKMAKGGNEEQIAADLANSEKYLKMAGDPLQLSKTILEMVRLKLRQGDRNNAIQLAQRAWHELAGYADDFFPEEFRYLLETGETSLVTDTGRIDFLKRFFHLTETLLPLEEENTILLQTVRLTNRLFGAERGGLFLFPDGKYSGDPELKAGCNLSKIDTEAAEFQPGMKLILKAFRTQKTLVQRSPGAGKQGIDKPVKAVMCIPIQRDGKTQGVLYHDNTYLSDAFDFSEISASTELVALISRLTENALEHVRVKRRMNRLASERSLRREEMGGSQIIANSPGMKRLLNQLDQAAASNSAILLYGETGTGKELVARRIHETSFRSDGPFIVLDCSTIPENLVESELFGYEKGAFTGAAKRKLGRIEMCHKGTLFLDEIGELPLSAQAKFLRVIQEKSFCRIGGGRMLNSDFRLICATNRNLVEEIARRQFREDLYYRINVVTFTLPPLRERGEDAVALARSFLERVARKNGRRNLHLSPEDEENIRGYWWPGNIRELKNVIERAVILSQDDSLELNLPISTDFTMPGQFNEFCTLEDLQRRYIRHILEYTDGKVSGSGGAAEILGLKRTSLYSRMRSLGMAR